MHLGPFYFKSLWSLCWEGVLTVSSLLFTHTLYMWTGEESLSGVEGGAHRNRVSEACGQEEAAAAAVSLFEGEDEEDEEFDEEEIAEEE